MNRVFGLRIVLIVLCICLYIFMGIGQSVRQDSQSWLRGNGPF